MWAIAFGFIGILPQLIYWKIAAGTFVYDVGSKWVFLNPFFRVLFGWETGWFIYTPVTIFFILGFFFIKNYPFKRSVIIFCLLNIWIIISWFDWKYGATYSTRALVQSYPVFAFPFTAFIERITLRKWRFLFYPLVLYLIYVNMFQLEQYDKTVLHYRDMNRQYYARIYLNRNPTPLDMSLLDTDEILSDEKGYDKTVMTYIDSTIDLKCTNQSDCLISETVIEQGHDNHSKIDTWVKIESTITIQSGFSNSHLNCELQSGDSVKKKKIRLFSPISKNGEANKYEFYVRIPDYANPINLKLFISTANRFMGKIEETKITYLEEIDNSNR